MPNLGVVAPIVHACGLLIDSCRMQLQPAFFPPGCGYARCRFVTKVLTDRRGDKECQYEVLTDRSSAVAVTQTMKGRLSSRNDP